MIAVSGVNQGVTDLAAVNSVAQLDLRGEFTGVGVATFQYATGGAGTVVLEGTMDGTQWDIIQFIKLADGSTAASATAPGSYSAALSSLEGIRVRKTVGTASCRITLGFKR